MYNDPVDLRGVAGIAVTLAGCGRINFDLLGSGAHSTLRLDRYDAGEPLVDMPVLLVLDSRRIDKSIALPDGSDLRVYDEAGTSLPLELEETSPFIVWVRVPRIEGTTTELTLAYGDPSAPVASGTVWPDADAVWHFGTIFGARDATANHHDAVPFGNAVSGDGFRGSGWNLDGASALVVANTGWAPAPTLTVSGHIFVRSSPDTFCSIVNREYGTAEDDDFWLGTHAGHVYGTLQADDFYAAEGGVVSNNQWHALATTYDGTMLTSFLDGVPVATSPAAGTVQLTPSNAIFLGASCDNTDMTNQTQVPDADWIDGMIDEVRIEHVYRSAAWIAASGISIGDAWITYGPIEYD